MGLAVACLAFPPLSASAETIAKTVQRNKTAAMVPIFAYDRESCEIYPVTDVTVTAQPAHGSTNIVTHAMPLGKSAGVCAGKARQHAVGCSTSRPRNYTGTDRISISWTLPESMVCQSAPPHGVYVSSSR